MSEEESWIKTLISESCKHQPLITKAATERMDSLLRGQLGDRPLTLAELTTIAKELLADMDSLSPAAEADQ